MRGVVISLCDLTGVMVQPWVDAGYSAVLVDPQHPEGVTTDGAITRVGHVIDHPAMWRVLRDVADRTVFVSGFPPCTDLAVSGARWFALKAEKDPSFQFKAMQVVWQCQVAAEMLGVPYIIENPISRISSFWRKPDHRFDPCDFTALEAGDNYTKATALWTGGGFVMPEKQRLDGLPPPDDRIHKCSPGPDRSNIRSATPRGFARAVFLSNAPHLRAQMMRAAE